MGGGASRVKDYATEQAPKVKQKIKDYAMEEEADGDDDDEDDDSGDDDDKIWENGLLDLSSKSFRAEDLGRSMSDTETLVGRRRPITRKRSSTWSHPQESASKMKKTVKRSFMCCTGNSIALKLSVNFQPHISDLADLTT